ncbi:hypothetical protein HED50_09955 [Ochrobactrum oryzae]|nr:hypothetical protein [Brucella oryzae]
MRVFCKGSTGAKSKGGSSKNNLFIFLSPWKVERRFVRRSDVPEMGDSERKFQSRKCFVDHTFVRHIFGVTIIFK